MRGALARGRGSRYRSGVRRAPLLLPLALAVPALLGMGALGGGQSPKVPTDLKYAVSAEFEDASGTRLHIEKVNIDGEEHLRGKLGEGLLLIPFSRIRSLSFAGADARTRTARADLVDGRQVTLEVKSDTEFSGASEFGAYYVQVRDLKTVQFDHSEAEGSAEAATAAAPEGAPRIPGL